MSQPQAKEIWHLLNNYLTILENLVKDVETNFEKNKKNYGTMLADLRVAERSFNFLIDVFSDIVDQQEGKPVMFFLTENFEGEGEELWNKLKNRRDKLADSISKLIESDPELIKRYEEYCDNLKKLRILGAML